MQRPETLPKMLSVRIKGAHAKVLSRMAVEVNQVWNLANELSHEAWHIPLPEAGWIQDVWLCAFDIQKELAGINKARGCRTGAQSRWRLMRNKLH